MNIRHVAHSTLLSLTLLTFSSVALSSDLYNVKEFEVYGITLGDDADQVINAMTEFYSVTEDDLDITRSSNLGEKDPATYYIDYRANDIKFNTYFGPFGSLLGKPDADKSHYLVELNIRMYPKIDNYEEFAKKYIEKYGSPTVVSSFRKSATYEWCEKLNAEKTRCDDDHAGLYLSEKRISLRINNIRDW